MKKYLLLSLIVAMFGCQPKYISTTSGDKNSELDVRNLEYTYLSTKGKLIFNSKGKETKLAVDTRIEKDKQMWMSMRVAKIEGLRVLATKDSVFALLKMEKEAYALSYDDVELLLGTRIDYDLLQSIFTGDLPSTFEDSRVKMGEDDFLLTRKDKGLESIASVNRTSQKLEKIAVLLKKEKKVATIDYDTFKPVVNTADQSAPFHSLVKVGVGNQDKVKAETTVELNFSKIEVEPEAQKMPFKIPSKYKKKGREDLVVKQ
ncbi:DUF4292 domain-containing protein [Flammeovirga aprica]|uniref:DUF4292 domain-containing protein n=1 Tax=Flammeovirga aprica JL-4 TaxID=694437 RepID=A0A7X9RXG6_9BACT|nr:DUF4292 domain-containing protein [Flammeovirga aprica]NME70515.1 DUF4292 domain-containing protein [Flammeovirga aprica JL-4]